MLLISNKIACGWYLRAKFEVLPCPFSLTHVVETRNRDQES